ncbi:acyltransferase family protein [Nocardioides sp.]|uniref:acyltransferase family protein n=1 Tax=Nocardioides sp. TaxID=35761 RepID=UPI0035194A34
MTALVSRPEPSPTSPATDLPARPDACERAARPAQPDRLPPAAARGRRPVAPARERIAGLDTLRAVAVLLVVGYHLHVPGLPGGFLGVTIFFVISGYLITRLLLEELRTTGSVDLGAFYRRRIRRLLPAAYLVVVAALAWATLVQRDLLVRLPGDAWAALGYVSNWSMILRDVSYFESFALPSPLAHFWSLAVEEQFYLFWPPVLLALILLLRRRRTALLAVGGAAVLSTLLLAVLHVGADDPSRAYMGTDTRAAELLVGALLALALHRGGAAGSRPRPALDLTPWRARLLLAVGAGVLVVLVRSLGDDAVLVYRGGLLLAAVAAGAVVVAAQSPALSLPAGLDRGLPGWFGRRSYAIYLWHYPVLIACSTPADLNDFSPLKAVLVVGLTLALAAASYRWVERPVLRWGVRGALRRLRRRLAALSAPARSGSLLGAMVVAAVAMLGLTGAIGPIERDHGPSVVTVGAAADTAEPVIPAEPAPGASPASGGAARPAAPPVVPLTGRATVAIGDSLMIDISGRLERIAPGISIDARVGRQPWDGLKVANRFARFNRPGATYVLGIGTNGAIDTDDLDTFVRGHRAARVLLITPRVDRSWEDDSVRAIRTVARRHANVGVVDFHRLSKGHPEWFAPDGVHLTGAGVRAMVAEIARVARSTPQPTRPA